MKSFISCKFVLILAGGAETVNIQGRDNGIDGI